jgi:hypothetical protein
VAQAGSVPGGKLTGATAGIPRDGTVEEVTDTDEDFDQQHLQRDPRQPSCGPEHVARWGLGDVHRLGASPGSKSLGTRGTWAKNRGRTAGASKSRRNGGPRRPEEPLQVDRTLLLRIEPGLDRCDRGRIDQHVESEPHTIDQRGWRNRSTWVAKRAGQDGAAATTRRR